MVGSLGVTRAALGALARRADLWPAAVVTAWKMAVPGWWRRWPPRPFPDPAYLAFRSQTMFGGDGCRRLGPEELLDYLEWCRDQRPARRT
ncbi:MAG: hypothetical protein J2P57_16430 [Acidimicrobiaceae bacterium]|nr:hypothetical protein [Acidimicrobiaceae bacterium]